MPQLQSLVLTDRSTPTPDDLTFLPRDIVAGVGTVINTGGVPIGEKRVSVSSRKANSRYHGELRLVIPVVATETVNGISRPVVVRTAYVTVKTSFDEKSSEQERDDAIGLTASALSPGKALVNDALVKLEGVY